MRRWRPNSKKVIKPVPMEHRGPLIEGPEKYDVLMFVTFVDAAGMLPTVASMGGQTPHQYLETQFAKWLVAFGGGSGTVQVNDVTAVDYPLDETVIPSSLRDPEQGPTIPYVGGQTDETVLP